MVNLDQVRNGLLRYIDTEIVSKMGGLKMWGLAFASVMLVDSYMNQFSGILSQMGLMNQEGMIDLDKVYSQFLDIARAKGSVTENFAMIGPVTFTEQDITKLYSCIRG